MRHTRTLLTFMEKAAEPTSERLLSAADQHRNARLKALSLSRLKYGHGGEPTSERLLSAADLQRNARLKQLGYERGMDTTAKRLFGKPLAQLSPGQVALGGQPLSSPMASGGQSGELTSLGATYDPVSKKVVPTPEANARPEAEIQAKLDQNITQGAREIYPPRVPPPEENRVLNAIGRDIIRTPQRLMSSRRLTFRGEQQKWAREHLAKQRDETLRPRPKVPLSGVVPHGKGSAPKPFDADALVAKVYGGNQQSGAKQQAGAQKTPNLNQQSIPPQQAKSTATADPYTFVAPKNTGEAKQQIRDLIEQMQKNPQFTYGGMSAGDRIKDYQAKLTGIGKFKSEDAWKKHWKLGGEQYTGKRVHQDRMRLGWLSEEAKGKAGNPETLAAFKGGYRKTVMDRPARKMLASKPAVQPTAPALPKAPSVPTVAKTQGKPSNWHSPNNMKTPVSKDVASLYPGPRKEERLAKTRQMASSVGFAGLPKVKKPTALAVKKPKPEPWGS
jgi:hypothetical protein